MTTVHTSQKKLTLADLSRDELMTLVAGRVTVSQADIAQAKAEASFTAYRKLSDEALAALDRARTILRQKGHCYKYLEAAAQHAKLHERAETAYRRYDRYSNQAQKLFDEENASIQVN